MSGPSLSVAKQALLALEQMRERLAAAEQAGREPVAVIGIGVRVPGASDPEAFWTLLREGVDATSDIPPDRWDVDAFYDPDPDAIGKINAKRGGFLAEVDRFDAEFFGVSPREARSMDPQHRLLLEVAWEAIEHAGIAPTDLSGSRTGVFVGVTVDDYLHLLVGSGEQRLLDAYAHHGNVLNAAAGRLSYVLGLHGPSMAIDTACSSSLVATHLACQSLRSRDCDLALAGGVNLVLSPLSSVRLARGHMLAPDGRCKTFDASADGYARGEGCGVLVLKRLSAALADGDRVLAVIRGSAVNQDGHTSALTVPNGLAQRSVIRDALANAGLEPADVSYVEAHGTGTALGDPIEMDAIADVLGSGRRAPLLVGSVKTNIGHLESASGVAGVIKVVLALQHGMVPPNLHFKTPSPHIPWTDRAVAVPTVLAAWPPQARRIAGVSSFGASGTNAHVVLEQAPEPAAPSADPDRSHYVLPLSAESDAALRGLAARYVAHFDTRADVTARDVCYTAAAGRAHFVHRAAITGRDIKGLRAGAAVLAEGQTSGSLQQGVVERGETRKIAFLFTGQGSQYWGMGRELFETEPAFRAALEACAVALQPHLDVPLLTLLYDESSKEGQLLDKTAFTQPALFSVEYALARMFGAWGVTPAAVMGHSVGEFAAACVAGVLTLEDAARMVAVRGRLMQALPEGGAMVAIATDETTVRARLTPYAQTISIAAVNAPDQTVLSGNRASLEALLHDLNVPEPDRRWLVVSHAFHSPLMLPMLDAFEAEAARAVHATPLLPFVSNLTGEVIRTLDAPYWKQHAAMPVRFADGLKAMAAMGCSVFVEIGPTPALLPLARRVLVEEASVVWIPTLRRGRGDAEQIAKAIGAVYTGGAAVNWRAVGGNIRRRPVSLPTYPFARDRHWFESTTIVKQNPAVSREAAATTATAGPGRYEVVWRRTPPRSPADVAAPAKPWVVLTTGNDAGAALADSVEKRGWPVLRVAPGSAFGRSSATAFTARADSREDFDALCQALGREFGGAAAVVHAWGAQAAPVSEPSAAWIRDYSQAACESLLLLTQALCRAATPTALYVLTSGAADVAGGLDIACHQSSLWGLARTIAREQPELRCAAIDLDPSLDASAQTDRLLADAAANALDNQVAYRAGDRYAARLAAVPLAGGPAHLGVSGDATYLITGGMGGAGFATAEWLASRGARHLALMGRREPSPATLSGIRALEERHGATVHVVSADVSDERALAAALDHLGRTLPPVRGVVHAAGVLADGVLLDQDWGMFERAMAAKAFGAWNLHTLTRQLPLDFFVLFSSFAGVAGSAGQANYAAANAFLDGLAQHRRACGRPATSVAWGPWQVGMLAALDESQRERWRRLGLQPMTPERALEGLDAAIGGGRAQVAVLDVDWAKFVTASRRERDPFLEELARPGRDPVPVTSVSGAKVVNDALAEEVAAAPLTRRRTLLVDAIEEEARTIFGANGRRIDPRRPLRELGLDSLMAVELRNALGARLRRTLPATLLFDYPTIENVADYVLREVLADGRRSAPALRVSGEAVQPERALDIDEIDGLSADQAEELLLAELKAAEELGR
jgi:acyl transferase domain-containing protein